MPRDDRRDPSHPQHRELMLPCCPHVYIRSERVPYPEFCRHPEKCAGKGSCPRDITCAD